MVDIVLAVVALLLAVLPWSGADASGRAVLFITAALLGLLILRTSYAPKPVRAPRSRGDMAEDVGRSAGRLVGKGVKAVPARTAASRTREVGGAASGEIDRAQGHRARRSVGCPDGRAAARSRQAARLLGGVGAG